MHAQFKVSRAQELPVSSLVELHTVHQWHNPCHNLCLGLITGTTYHSALGLGLIKYHKDFKVSNPYTHPLNRLYGCWYGMIQMLHR